MRQTKYLIWLVIVPAALGAISAWGFQADSPQRAESKENASSQGPESHSKATASVGAAEPGKSEGADATQRIAAATRGVIGSKHDFSALTGRPGDACSACHVPHVQAVQPSGEADESFALTFYRMGGQQEVLVPDRYMPGPTSLTCLSCHNGTVAASTVGSSHVVLSAHREGFEVGEFSTRDHPIGVPYPERQPGYKSRAALLAAGAIPLPQGRVECVSCHDPHDASGVDKMLVISNRRSALCLACHEK